MNAMQSTATSVASWAHNFVRRKSDIGSPIQKFVCYIFTLSRVMISRIKGCGSTRVSEMETVASSIR